MATLTKADLNSLTLDEHISLIDHLWDGVDDSPEALGPPDWHRQMLDQFLNEEERNPQPPVAREEVRAELSRRWSR